MVMVTVMVFGFRYYATCLPKYSWISCSTFIISLALITPPPVCDYQKPLSCASQIDDFQVISDGRPDNLIRIISSDLRNLSICTTFIIPEDVSSFFK